MAQERSGGGLVVAIVIVVMAVLLFPTPAGVGGQDSAANDEAWSADGIREWFDVNVLGTSPDFEPVVVNPDSATSSSLPYAPLVAVPVGEWPEGEAGIDAFLAAAGIPVEWSADGASACPAEAQACTRQSWCEGAGCPFQPPVASIHLRADDPTLFPVITDAGASVLVHELGHVQQAAVFSSHDELVRVLDELGFGGFTGHDGAPVPAVEGHAECYTQALVESSAYFAGCPLELKERAVDILLERHG